jgi:HAAS
MMEGAGLGNRLVRDNLRELDAALATLPTARARELREQITAHLDEALQPGADDQSVAATLGRLGAPADLAADAGAVAGRRTWIRLAAAVVVTGIEAGYCSSVAGDLNDRDRAAVGIQRDGLPTCVALSLDRPDRHASRFERRGRRFDIRHRYGHDACGRRGPHRARYTASRDPSPATSLHLLSRLRLRAGQRSVRTRLGLP